MKLKLWQKIQRLLPLKAIPYSNYILVVILILGFTLRFFKLTSLPLYGDELTMVYDSYSILKTGTDQTGEPFPLTFKMGSGRPAGYVYASIPFIALFGTTEIGVRGLSLASGMGIIILMYFLGKKLFTEKVGLVASFLASISLWDIYLSRAGFEAHFALFLALFGVTLFLYQKYIPMALLFGLAVFTYPTFKLTIPLVILLLVFFSGFWKTFKNKSFVLAFIILLIFAVVSLLESFRGVSEARFADLNVLSANREHVTQKINEQRFLSTLPERFKPLIYNKPYMYGRILLDNYVENLSPSFLFLRGDLNPRHNPGEWGMLYLFEFPILLIALYEMVNNKDKRILFLTVWIMIIPVATMLMGQTHALRNNFMLPPFLLITAYTLSKFSLKTNLAFIFLFLAQLVLILVNLYTFVPNKFGSFWSSEAKTTSLKAISDSKNGMVILTTKIDNIEYAYPVYAKIDPKEVIAQYGNFPKVYGNVIISNEK